MKQEERQTLEIEKFTTEQVLTTAQLSTMSKKNLHKHIEYLEKVALGLNQGLELAIGQLNIKMRAVDGTIL